MKVKLCKDYFAAAILSSVIVTLGIGTVFFEIATFETIESIILECVVFLLPLGFILYVLLGHYRRKLEYAVIERDKVTSYYFGHRICQVDFEETVYFFETRNVVTGNKEMYVSNSLFLYKNQDKPVFSDYSEDYDWKNVIGFEVTADVKSKIPWRDWVNIEEYYHERKFIERPKKKGKETSFPLDHYCNCDKADIVLYIAVLGYSGIVISEGNYFHLVYPVCVLVFAVYSLLKKRKKELRYYLRTEVTDEAFVAIGNRKTVCVVSRTNQVYYKIIHSSEASFFVYSYVIVSNSPFFVENEKKAISTYDIHKQVLVLYDVDTAEYFDFEHWIEV